MRGKEGEERRGRKEKERKEGEEDSDNVSSNVTECTSNLEMTCF